MTEEKKPKDKTQRLPRLAIFVIVFGLVVSAAVLALAHLPGGSSKDAQWDSEQPIVTSVKPKPFNNGGSLALTRTTLSGLAPNISDESIFMISGVARIDSGGKSDTTLTCDVAGKSKIVLNDAKQTIEQTAIARTIKLRAAWPRPSGDLDLSRQEVPELAVTKFHSLGADVLGMPIRDYFRRYTDSTFPVTVDWDTDPNSTRQTWIWNMPQGTGSSPASLAFAVIFKSIIRPKGTITCKAVAGKSTAQVGVPFVQKQYPVVDTSDDTSDSEASSASDVQ